MQHHVCLLPMSDVRDHVVMERLAEFVLHHRKRVMAFWALMLVLGAVAAGQTTKRLTTDFSLPGQPGFTIDQQVQKLYGNGGFSTPLLVVVTSPGDVVAQAPAAHAALTTALSAALTVPVPVSPQTGRPVYGGPGGLKVRVADYTTDNDPSFLTRDRHTTFALVQAPVVKGFGGGFNAVLAPELGKAFAGTGLTAQLTGYNLLGVDSGSTGPSLLSEVLLGGLGALAVLSFVFASFLALVPLLVAAVSITSTFIALLALTYIADVSFIVQFLVALIGLGVGIDYSLLLVTRWREERAHGRTNEEAVVEAMRTAGHAVISSGVTVGISLLALVVLPVPFLRSVGYGGMLIPVISTVVVMTLVPALLGGIGPRVDWPRIRKEGSASRGWTAWTRLVVRRRWIAAAVSLGLLVALAIPLASIQIGTARTAALASSGAAYDALQVLEKGGISSGVTTPVEVLIKADADAAAIVTKARAVGGILTAFAPADAAWSAGGTRVVEVLPKVETVDNNTVKVIDRVKTALAGTPGVIGVTGQGALVVDYVNAVYKSFPYVLLVISLITFLLLARTFRSLLLPLKAVLLNLLSVSATFGAAVLFWQDGYGSSQIFGIASTGAITFWLPLMIFAFLFGLSMDYEVFILARSREEYDRLGSTDEAIVQGLGRTGRLVTSAALILFLAFTALGAAPNTDIKVFATALGVGILLDATVVRALLVPALVSLFGRWNWWLPGGVAKVLRVEPSPLPPKAPRGTLPPTPEPVLEPV